MRKKNMNIQTVSQRFRSVQCFVREIFEEMFYSNFRRLCMETPCCVPLKGTNMGPEANKNISHQVLYKELVVVF